MGFYHGKYKVDFGIGELVLTTHLDIYYTNEVNYNNEKYNFKNFDLMLYNFFYCYYTKYATNVLNLTAARKTYLFQI